MKYRWRVKIPALQFLTLSHYFKGFMIQTPDTMELFLSQRGFSVWHVIRAVRHFPHAISLRMWPQTDRLCLSQFLRSSTYIYLSIYFIPTHPFSVATCLPLATPYETITKLHVNQPTNQSIFNFNSCLFTDFVIVALWWSLPALLLILWVCHSWR